MFRMSGIFRDVYLYNTPLVSVRDHYITAALDKQSDYHNGTMKVRLALDNRDRMEGSKEVTVRLFTPEGKLLTEVEKSIRYAKNQPSSIAEFEFPLSNLTLWTAETPELYTVHVVQRAEGKEEMAFSTKFGFRDIEISVVHWFISTENECSLKV